MWKLPLQRNVSKRVERGTDINEFTYFVWLYMALFTAGTNIHLGCSDHKWTMRYIAVYIRFHGSQIYLKWPLMIKYNNYRKSIIHIHYVSLLLYLTLLVCVNWPISKCKTFLPSAVELPFGGKSCFWMLWQSFRLYKWLVHYKQMVMETNEVAPQNYGVCPCSEGTAVKQLIRCLIATVRDFCNSWVLTLHIMC